MKVSEEMCVKDERYRKTGRSYIGQGDGGDPRPVMYRYIIMTSKQGTSTVRVLDRTEKVTV